MSTLLSTDMNLDKPSTKVHAPPGGRSSLQLFGDDGVLSASVALPKQTLSKGAIASATKPKASVILPDNAAVSTTPPTTPSKADLADIVVNIAQTPEFKNTGNSNVGLVVLKEDSEYVIGSAMKALTTMGMTDVTVVEVPHSSAVVHAAHKLCKSCDGVMVVVYFKDDKLQHSILSTALYNLSCSTGKPVIPGVMSEATILETKALLPERCTVWAQSLCALTNDSSTASSSSGTGAVTVTAIEPYTAAAVEIVKPVSESMDSAAELLAAFKETLKKRGCHGILSIGRKFRIMDDDNSGMVSISEFSKAVAEHTLEWSADQNKILFDFFDADGSGEISVDEFLLGLRGALNERRQQLVLMAFEILDADKSGAVEINDIKAKYNANKHPDVIAGRRTTDDVLREFLDTFDSEDKDGKVTPEEFCKYYSNVSSSIDNDDYFELMIRNAWHISGGEGWCANTSCRRVLVSHSDGTQTVEEIKNDLGIAATDKEAMIANLIENGVEDIAGIDLFGSVDTASAAKKNAVAKKKPALAVEDVVEAPSEKQPEAPPSPGNKRRVKGGATTIVLG